MAADGVTTQQWQRIDNLVAKEQSALLALFRDLHQNPELSHEEKETSARYAKELRAAGFTVTERFGGYGVVGVLKNGKGPTPLLRADMDALPIQEATGLAYASKNRGVMHACGHDVHMTNAIGTARVLSAMKDAWRGTVIIIGQPAEERGAGSKQMLKAGLRTKFPKYDQAVGLHIHDSLEAGKLSFLEGFILASVDSVDITIRGQGGHGAAPHLGIDPIVMSAEFITALQTIVSRNVEPIKDAVVTVGSIHGGTKHNIIPDEVKLQLTLRTFEPDVRATLLKRITALIHGIAQAHGAPKPSMRTSEGVPSTFNDPALGRRLMPVLKAAGKGFETGSKGMYGEDFSRYALGQKVPTTFFSLGVMPKAKAKRGYAHSAKFQADVKAALPSGIRAMVGVVLTLQGR